MRINRVRTRRKRRRHQEHAVPIQLRRISPTVIRQERSERTFASLTHINGIFKLPTNPLVIHSSIFGAERAKRSFMALSRLRVRTVHHISHHH